VEAAIDDIAIETFTAGVAAVTDGGTRATADLEQNRPNPFRPGAALTNIRFALSNPGDAKLAIFDASGRLVRTLLQGPMQSGAHTPVWNALDDNGKEVGAGVHFCRLTSGGFEQSRGLANDIDTIYTYDNAAFARVPGLSVLAP
jgi:flagellar hook assembly protein FlgD